MPIGIGPAGLDGDRRFACRRVDERDGVPFLLHRQCRAHGRRRLATILRWMSVAASRVWLYTVGMRKLPREIADRSSRLFWDVDVSSLDFERHEDFIVGRVLMEGDWSAVRALRRELGDDRMAQWLGRAGRRLDRRTRRFLETVLEIPADQCETTSWKNDKDRLFAP
jgi:hypothetical protein